MDGNGMDLQSSTTIICSISWRLNAPAQIVPNDHLTVIGDNSHHIIAVVMLNP
jgi:hypothetical protein